ncbi:MAG: hypothetical protein IJ306_08290, partial [Oscillospiraceae bacterium]|nr:hypothetical protein [Oscillospiraceae bacterium]
RLEKGGIFYLSFKNKLLFTHRDAELECRGAPMCAPVKKDSRRAAFPEGKVDFRQFIAEKTDEG